MPTYSYKAKNKAGVTVTGTVEAADERQAAGMIREQGALPMDIRPLAVGAQPTAKPAGSVVTRYLVDPLWTGVNIRTLTFFYRQMATLLGSGMSLSEALTSVGRRTGGRMGRIIAAMHDRVVAGGRISQEMERHPRIFAPLQLSLVRIGESGGLLEPMIDRIASYLEYEMSVRRMVSRVTFYPILVFLAILIIPHVPVLILKGFGPFVDNLWAGNRSIAVFLLCTLVALKLLFQFRPVRLMWDSIKITPPVVGTVARKIAMSRFSKALAVLYSAGLPMTQAVAAAADASANEWISHRIRSVLPALQAGEGLTESLARTGCVLTMVLDMLSTGERTGSMDAVLNKVADYMDEEADATIHKLGIAVFVLAILVAGGVVLMMLVQGYTNMVPREGM